MNAYWQSFVAVLPDVVQILILYVVIYAILKAARGSRFGQALMGIAILFALLIAFTQLFHFKVLSVVVRWLLIYLAVSSVVIFQPEIRRVLASMGAFLFSDRHRAQGIHSHTTPDQIVSILFKLAKTKTGALIAFERGISLRGYEATGVSLDALVSPELFFAIFTEPMPLHDGGVVMRHGRIAAAHCLFPVSSMSDLSASGMRHRAAVGLSEETDALVLVVSEETGRISVAHNGKLIRYPDTNEASRTAILRWVRKAMPQQKTTAEAIADWLRRRRERHPRLFGKPAHAEPTAEETPQAAAAPQAAKETIP
jgi:diadenylate cyclase